MLKFVKRLYQQIGAKYLDHSIGPGVWNLRVNSTISQKLS